MGTFGTRSCPKVLSLARSRGHDSRLGDIRSLLFPDLHPLEIRQKRLIGQPVNPAMATVKATAFHPALASIHRWAEGGLDRVALMGVADVWT